MSSTLSRRYFIASLGAVAAASTLPVNAFAGKVEPSLYPPVDLSYFDRPLASAPADIRFGYAAITWNEKDDQAIKDISEIGFRGIQLRNNILKEYGDRPKALRDLLDQNHLEMVALSSGGVVINSANETGEIARPLPNARFVYGVGGPYPPVTHSTPSKEP